MDRARRGMDRARRGMDRARRGMDRARYGERENGKTQMEGYLGGPNSQGQKAKARDTAAGDSMIGR